MYLLFTLFVAMAVSQQAMQSQQQEQQGGQTLEQALKACSDCSSATTTLFTNEHLDQLPKEPFTLLVPNNQAIIREQSALSAIPKEQKLILVKNHVLKGTQRELKSGNILGLSKSHQVSGQKGNFKIGEAKVIGEYHPADMGRGFFVIDKVLLPESSQSDQGSQTGMDSASGQQGSTQPTQLAGQQGQQQELWQMIQADPQLSEISQFVQRHPALKQVLTGPLTFFLPNNQALSQVRQRVSTISADKAVDFIRFHIVYGIVPQLVDNMRLATLLPEGDLIVNKVGRGFTVNNANVIGQFRQGISNQGFYVIDKVLFPEQTQRDIFQGMQQGQPQAQPQPVQ